jgi:YegS/Rv2252/BmrU family lipid kinase
MPTLVILNPYAGNGRVGREWPGLASLLRQHFGELLVVETQTAAEVQQQIEAAYDDGIRRVIALGGDGTNFVVVNAIMRAATQSQHREPMGFGTLPVGTGRDWARSRGIPLNPRKAVEWLAAAQPTPIDIGRVDIEGTNQPPIYYLNVASAGIGGDVDTRIQAMAKKRSWSYLQATTGSILHYDAQHMQVILDGTLWLDQPLFLVVVANGTTFGHGMRIAPDASISDGLFDVVVLDKMSRLRVLRKLWHVYNATHLTVDGVYFRRAHEVQIISPEGVLPIDMDGELTYGQSLRFRVEPGALQMLL